MGMNNRELTFIGLMGVLNFILSFLLGSILNIATGIPIASGFITFIIQGIIFAICILTVKKFWVAIMISLIYGILAIPTNMLGGVPGVYKILIELVFGFSLAIVVYIFKYKLYSLYLGELFTFIVGLPLMIYLYTILNVPGSEIIIKYWYIGFIIFFAEGCLGIWIGTKIFNKIKDKRAIKLIRGN